MSVTSATLIQASCKEDKDGFATYTAVFEVQTNDRQDSAVTIRFYSGLPQIGSFYALPGIESDISAVAVSRDIQHRENPSETAKLWRVIVTYSNNPAEQPKRDPTDPPLLPWNEPPEIEIVAAKDKEAYLFDLDGYLVASSAGEPYDPVQERDRSYPVLRIAQNQLFADVGFYVSYADAINSDPFFGGDPFTAKVEIPGATKRLWYGTTPYYHVVWEFGLNANGWRKRLYDYGMYRKVGTGATAKLEVLKDLHGHPLTAPRLLNGSGGVLAVGSSPVFVKPNPADLTRDYFKEYPEMEFAPLNLAQFF